MDVFAPGLYQYKVFEVTFLSIKEKYLIFERGENAYFGELGHVFKPLVSIHIPKWFVMDYPFQFNVEVNIFGLLPGLVHNDEWNEAFPFISGKNK